MKMPTTLARINTELRQRGVRSLDDLHMSPEVLRDDREGVFLRLHFSTVGGDYFVIDTFEASELLMKAMVH